MKSIRKLIGFIENNDQYNIYTSIEPRCFAKINFK